MTNERKKALKKAMENLAVVLDNFENLHVALTHPSYVFEKGIESSVHNQRLEFLGDAIVGLIVAENLFEKYPEKTEGELTKMRAAIVCEASLARAASKIGIGEMLLMGKGEKMGGGSKRSSNLADAWEAVVAAIYLDKGMEAARDFCIKFLKEEIEKAISGDFGDYKTQLQELVQKNPDHSIRYKILDEQGPDHEKIFFSGVYINKDLIAKGEGKTKKEAEQKAAKAALIKLNDDND